MRSFLLLLFMCFLFQAPVALAGARITLNPSTQFAELSAKFVLYSATSVSPETAEKIRYEIETLWSGRGLRPADPFIASNATVNGASYLMMARVEVEIVDYAIARQRAAVNVDPAVNFFKVSAGDARFDRSYVDSVAANCGEFFESDDLGKSTTAAHEFGHALGLLHTSSPQGLPSVMTPRGAKVEAKYRWDPSSSSSTLSPYTRRVIQKDIDALALGTRTVSNYEILIGLTPNCIYEPNAIPLSRQVLVAKVYPNPVQHGNPVQLSISMANDDTVEIFIYSMNGALEKRSVHNVSAGISNFALKAAEGLPIGMHLIVIRTSDGPAIVKKLIVQ